MDEMLKKLEQAANRRREISQEVLNLQQEKVDIERQITKELLERGEIQYLRIDWASIQRHIRQSYRKERY